METLCVEGWVGFTHYLFLGCPNPLTTYNSFSLSSQLSLQPYEVLPKDLLHLLSLVSWEIGLVYVYPL